VACAGIHSVSKVGQLNQHQSKFHWSGNEPHGQLTLFGNFKLHALINISAASFEDLRYKIAFIIQVLFEHVAQVSRHTYL
jgi:hypothetical protein